MSEWIPPFFMDKWVPVALIAMLLVGGGGGYFLTSSIYSPQIKSIEDQLATSQQQVTSFTTSNQALSQDKAALEASKASLQSQFDSLQTSYTALQTTNTKLQSDYAVLSSQYDTLKSGVDASIASLSEDYTQLKKDYEDLSKMVGNNVYGTPGDTQMLNNFKTLSLAVRSLNSTLWEYCNEVNSFKNTLTTADVLKMDTTVRSIIGSSTNDWTNYQNIHEYITSNVKYVYDIEFPFISQFWYLDVNGVRYLTNFNVATIENYVQKPEFTLKYKQGDCDDQAALEFAMLRYYNKYIVGTDYSLYLAEVVFSDGSSHVAVFMPVTGGKLTILDPSGNYLTAAGSSIAQKAASAELENYNSHWVSLNGDITQIRLYRINLTDGSYTMVSEGTRAQVASFLATR
jgi:hypothetical protein